MIKIDQEFEKRKLRSKMIVSVHDELVFDVVNGEEELVQKIVRMSMQNALNIGVPLDVADSFGKNWYEVK